MNGAGRIMSSTMREQQNVDDYGRDEYSVVKQMWKKVKREVFDSAREVCHSVKVGSKTGKREW